MRFNGLALNNETRIVTVSGGSVELTRTEFDLLASLLGTGRRVRSKADLVLTMRGQQYVTSYFVNEADKRSVEVHIANLRRKIGDDAATPALHRDRARRRLPPAPTRERLSRLVGSAA